MLLCCNEYYTVQSRFILSVFRWTLSMWPFNWMLISTLMLWCSLCSIRWFDLYFFSAWKHSVSEPFQLKDFEHSFMWFCLFFDNSIHNKNCRKRNIYNWTLKKNICIFRLFLNFVLGLSWNCRRRCLKVWSPLNLLILTLHSMRKAYWGCVSESLM